MKGYIGLIFIAMVVLLLIGVAIGAISFPQALEFMLGVLAWAFWIIVAICMFVLGIIALAVYGSRY